VASKSPTSIVVPAFNTASALRECLDSILAQGPTDVLEVIVVDDGSTDDTPNVLASYASAVRVTRTANCGASAARQLGLEQTSGTFVVFLDADDVLSPGTIRSRLDAIEKSGAEVAYTNWQRLEGSAAEAYRLSSIVKRRIEDIHPDPQVALFTDFWAPPGAYLFSRSLLDRMPPWSRTLPVIQDARYALDAAMAGARFVHVPEIGVLYRSSPPDQSLSRRDPRAFVKDCLTNAMEVEQLWIARGLTAERRRALARVYGYVTCELLRLGESSLGERAYQRLRVVEPRLRPSRAQISGLVGKVAGAACSRVVLRLLDALIQYRATMRKHWAVGDSR
jgi:hypothetical protein